MTFAASTYTLPNSMVVSGGPFWIGSYTFSYAECLLAVSADGVCTCSIGTGTVTVMYALVCTSTEETSTFTLTRGIIGAWTSSDDGPCINESGPPPAGTLYVYPYTVFSGPGFPCPTPFPNASPAGYNDYPIGGVSPTTSPSSCTPFAITLTPDSGTTPDPVGGSVAISA
jgi:hypothetical protein